MRHPLTEKFLSLGVKWGLCFCLILAPAFANPTGGSIQHGSASIIQNGNILTINQGTDKLIMGWQSFSIGQGETTRFVQPSSSSMALNRVYGGTRSMIDGRLEANGGVVLINPAGITVSKSGVVNVNTFIGSTRDISDEEFLKGGALTFKGTSDASIENYGTIHTEAGDIMLIAHAVENQGTLSSTKGTVGLAAGDEVLYQPSADEKLLIRSPGTTGTRVRHGGLIQAAAAEIKAAGNPYAVAINLDGVIESHGNSVTGIKPRVIVQATQGDIQMSGGAKIDAGGNPKGGFVSIQTPGNLEIGGVILATSSSGTGGEIRLLGHAIHLDSTAVADASGFVSGGKIFVGGDYQGGNNPAIHYASESLQTASTLRVDAGALLNASAIDHGNGGVIIQWSDGTTLSSGSVAVRGGPFGGNGGFAEISGHSLGFDGAVDLSAPRGKAGQVLFDPTWLFVESSPSYPLIDKVLPGITYSVGASSSSVSTAAIQAIKSGTVTLQANYIVINSPISLSPDVNLEIDSKNGYIDIFSTSLSASGRGGISLNAVQNSFVYLAGTSISSQAGDITINVQQRNSGDGVSTSYPNLPAIYLNGTTIQTDNGNISLSVQDGTASLNDIQVQSSTIQTGSGQISLNTPIATVSLTSSTLQGTNGGSVLIQSLDGLAYNSSEGQTVTQSSPGISSMNTVIAGSPVAMPSPPVRVATPSPVVMQGPFTSQPTVQTAVQSLTVQNNTASASSGGTFGSAGPGASESSSSSSSESSSSSDAASGSTASSDSSSGSTSSSSSSSSSSGSGSSSSGGSSQAAGARAQASAMNRMNNAVPSSFGSEFQHLNPFADMSDGGGAGSSGPGRDDQSSGGRAGAVSVNSPEMRALAPLNDLNVVFMLF